MRIGVDAMGGDHAPHEIVRGCVDGLEHLSKDDSLRLYGHQDVIRAELLRAECTDERIQPVQCSEVIEMKDSPVESLRSKRDSSIARMARDGGKGEIDAMISAGNTGAFAAACQVRTRPIKGVSRPGIAVLMPTFHGPVVICDVGANVSPKPRHLHEYARMCIVYAQAMLGISNPKVGIVSIGEEAAKGNALVREAASLIREDSTIEFIGNVEGRDVFGGTGDVFICDGFVGNVILKLTEGLSEGLFKTIFKELSDEDPALAKAFEPAVNRIWARHDFAEYGGAPLLGINSIAIICHGRSDRRAIANAIRVSHQQHQLNLTGVIAERMASFVGSAS